LNQEKKEAMDKSLKRKRGNIYKFLSTCFYLPQKKRFLQDNVFENFISAVKQVCSDANDFSTRMRDAMLEETEESTVVEYSKLFVGPFELLAPPYGSSYLEKGRRVMGDTTIEVLKMYNELGLSINKDFKEMPDHVAVELEFMHYLIEKEIQALERSKFNLALFYVERQEIFLNKFLLRWVPSFCENINNNTESKFYAALANCILIFLKNEQEHIQTNLQGINSGLTNKNRRSV
jgi:TorA maturation chaperone TorD